MNCTEARAAWHLQCDGELAQADARQLEAHLAACETCRGFAREMESMLGGLVRLRDETEAAAAHPAGRRTLRLWRIGLAASAAAAVLVAALGWRLAQLAPPAKPPFAARADRPAGVTVELGGSSAELYIALPASTRQANVHVVKLYPVVSADGAADSKPQSGAAPVRVAGAGEHHGYAMLAALPAVR